MSINLEETDGCNVVGQFEIRFTIRPEDLAAATFQGQLPATSPGVNHGYIHYERSGVEKRPSESE
jgi:hypothetical protein